MFLGVIFSGLEENGEVRNFRNSGEICHKTLEYFSQVVHISCTYLLTMWDFEGSAFKGAMNV